MKRSRTILLAVLSLAVAAPGCAPRQKPMSRRASVLRPVAAAPAPYTAYIPWGEHTVSTRLDEIGPRARERWRRYFRAAGVAYPAASVVLVGLKSEKQVEVYAGPSRQSLSYIRRIAMTAASGGSGPKLREGDRQVPEGIYEIDKLNPNSAYHVSLRVSYPNDFDEQMARRDGRRRLGGQIMIHGSAKSIGCIAVGDQAAEDLFVLAADAGVGGTSVVIVPRDFRRTRETDTRPGQPAWVRDLYAKLDRELDTLPAPRLPTASATRRGDTGAISSR